MRREERPAWQPLLSGAALALLVCVHVGMLPILAQAGDSPLSCAELGFTDRVSCATCRKLGEFLNGKNNADESLVAECNSCCSEETDKQQQASLFATASLEVCS